MSEPAPPTLPESGQTDTPSLPLRQRLGRWFWRLNAVYAVVLLLLMATFEYWGESCFVLSAPLYLPAWGWCLPSLVLLPIALFLNRRSAVLHIGLLVVLVWLVMDLEYNVPKTSPPDITVMAYNYGQRHGTDFADFAERVDADVILLVDAADRAPKYAERYPDRYAAGVGEFVIISRFPIVSSTRAVRDDKGVTRAARFCIRHPIGNVALYAVHLPTPREHLANLKGRLFGIPVPSKRAFTAAGRADYNMYLERKLALARDLALEVQNDPLPCIVAGDLNTPPKGVVYRALMKPLDDSFNSGGRGYGYTFPGDAYRRLAFRRPWLRLDYILHDSHWTVCDAETETGRRSQHLAVAAKLRFNP